MGVKSTKSAVGASAKIYKSQKSILAVARFFARLILRRGPAAMRRRIETIKSIARISETTPRREGQFNIGVLVQGAVGDNIIAARFLRDLCICCPNVVLDVYAANVSLSQWIYGGVSGLGRCLQDATFERLSAQYDASLIFEDTIRDGSIKPELSFYNIGRIATIFDSIKRFQAEHQEQGSYNRNGFLGQQLLYKHNTSRAKAAHFIAGIDYGGDKYQLPVDDDAAKTFGLSNRKYITVHNGFDLSQVTRSGSVTKVYPNFSEVVAEIRRHRNELAVVQIGSSTSVPISGTDLNLIGKTALRQAAALVKGASCHLDNEGGLVTVASCYGTPCCVVFGPSSPDYLSYQGNFAVRPIECGGCWWISDDWLSRCPRGLEKPVCMYSQPPKAVVDGVLKLLRAAAS